MKLQLENQYSFQKAEGWEDDPEAMTVDEIREQLKYWVGLLQLAVYEEHANNDLAYLEGFISSLANGEIEYTNPVTEFKYHAGFEYAKDFSVFAYSQEEADQLAMTEFKHIATWLPPVIGRAGSSTSSMETAYFAFKYMERNDDCGSRVYED